jgi:2,5-dihydroxypyridine 5,6-dioxygenase
MNSLPGLTEDLHSAARKLVDYMGVKRGESVVVTTDLTTDDGLAELIYHAAREQHAQVVMTTMARLPYQGGLADAFIPPVVAAAVGAADVWIDLTFPYMAGSKVQDAVMHNGRTRYLLCADIGKGGLLRLFGAVDLDAFFDALGHFEEQLASKLGASIRITDPLGSDVTFKLAKSPMKKPRRAEVPGSYLVPGTCAMYPEMESVKGVIKLTAVFHEYYTPLAEPLEVIVDGQIREVRGGGADRMVLERTLKRAANGAYGYIVHFTYAMNPGAKSTGTSFIEDSRVFGCNAVGMGLPWWVPGGGENHPDGVLARQSIWFDNELMVKDGLPVAKALVDAAQRLVPLPH